MDFLRMTIFITAVHILRENDNAYVIIDGEKVEFDKVVPVSQDLVISH